MATCNSAPVVSSRRLVLTCAVLFAAGCAHAPPLLRPHDVPAPEERAEAETATPADEKLAREQLKATRDAIQAAAGVRDHAPGQPPAKP